MVKELIKQKVLENFNEVHLNIQKEKYFQI